MHKHYKIALIFTLQIVLILAASSISILLLNNLRWGSLLKFESLHFVGVDLFVKAVCLQVFGLNQRWWRYVSIQDAVTISKAVLVAVAGLVIYSALPFARSFAPTLLILSGVLGIAFLISARAAVRLYREAKGQNLNSKVNTRRSSDVRALIIGAGMGGFNLVRRLKSAPTENVHIIGFVDDARDKRGMHLMGLPVLGKTKDLPSLVKENRITDLFIAIPSATKAEKNRIVDSCLGTGVRFKTIPSLQELVRGEEKPYELREVRVEDLLGRETIELNKAQILEDLHNQSVLVTGAGGSIGSELCRQILRCAPATLILLERSEYNLFFVERELRQLSPGTTIVPVIGDILDEKGLRATFQNYRPKFVYHAAAHKHVTLMEQNPREAIRNNILGTQCVAKISGEFGAQSFLMISTDKAVKPLSVMGYSKRMAEIIVQSLAHEFPATKFVSVRFGNVLGSSGSVVEIFRKQLAKGEALTVTDPEATRFFMTAPEAVELVLHSGSHGRSGEIYMLDMGQPVRIHDLARRMMDLADPSGRMHRSIQFTGLRVGEKLFEELYWEGEDSEPSEVEKVFRLRTKLRSQNSGTSFLQLKQILESSTQHDVAVFLKKVVNDLDAASSKVRFISAKDKLADVVPFQ